MTELVSRKMGFLEKFSVLAHNRHMGACAISAMIRVQGHIDFAVFQKAWHVLFQRHPLLRSTVRQAEQDYFFDFNAHFDNIPIKLLETTDTNAWQQEHDQNLFKPFSLNQYCWRATLIKIKNTSDNYIIIAAPHSHCDGRSLASLLGELLCVIIMLEKNETIDTASLPVPPALDDALNRTLFTLPTATIGERAEPWNFQEPVTSASISSENMLRVLPADLLTNLLAACRRNKTTITNAISAAYALSLLELQNQPSGPVDLFSPFNLRPYTKSKFPDNVLAFYSHFTFLNIDVAPNQSFWLIAQQIKEKFKQGFSEYQLPSADDNQLIEDTFTLWRTRLAQEKFCLPTVFSNIGILDAAFENIDKSLEVKSITFAPCLQDMPHALFIAGSTLNNTMYLNFIFPSPALQRAWVTALADKMLEKLTENINT